uniref:DUF5077 domain-containing protein n=1 Tax=uncultured bacterium contig00100(2014) TaxID=1465627 RepID=A0A060D1C5_9BACT|nr:hypothetical protein [uncultured bacterium contig00100(2014)]
MRLISYKKGAKIIKSNFGGKIPTSSLYICRMKKLFLTFILTGSLAAAIGAASGATNSVANSAASGAVTTIPIYGNAYVTSGGAGVDVGHSGGIRGWSSHEAVVSLFFHVSQPGTLNLALYGSSRDAATIAASVNGETFTVRVHKASDDTVTLGTTTLAKAGYVRLDLKGVERAGADFGTYSALKISGSATEGGKVTFVPSEPAAAGWPYWGRRGPSVHCRYDTSEMGDIRWFYNEVTIPQGMDPRGIYAMANGFVGGYFGLQVGSDGGSVRRVLFSVWSTFKTDDPKLIPAEYTVKGVRRGEGVTVKDFGNEGSGAQSFMQYDWEAGKTYKFLTSAEYDHETNSTVFTGYFCGHDGRWRLISALRQPHPAAKTYLGAYSFLENFMPNQGWIDRRVNFNNQWVCTVDGEWREVTNALFSYDNTARNGIRLDYAGWSDSNGFWLRNCGFFDDNTAYDAPMTRPATGSPPRIDLDALKKL